MRFKYAEEQVAANPDDIRARREVPVCYSKLGGVALRQANPTAALEFYRKYLAGSESLAAANPSSAEARRDLLVARSMVGDALLAARDYAAADQIYRQALELGQSLSQSDPRSQQKRMDIYVLLTKLADVNMRREQFDDAAQWCERARDNVRDSAQAGFITPAQRTELDNTEATLQVVCRQARRALNDSAWIATQPLAMARSLLGIRCLTFARRGEVRAAIESAEALRRLAPEDVESLVVVARAYSLCNEASSLRPSQVPVAAQAPPDVFAKKALDALKSAFRIQPTLAQNGWLEPEFNPLYAMPEYRHLLLGGMPQPTTQ